ncbi:MAG: hypothetical protein PWP23_1506 [Candidatus Sumerlaeota bacterium]|nr:hypothetical protein [Candidatus Sumerlaeota bacterium]
MQDRRYLVQLPNRKRTGPHAWEELVRFAQKGLLRTDATLIDDKTGERLLVSDLPQLLNLLPTNAPAPSAENAGTARTAMILGIASLALALLCGCVGSLAGGGAVFLGVRSLRQSQGIPSRDRTQALVGAITGGVAIVLGGLSTLVALAVLIPQLVQ